MIASKIGHCQADSGKTRPHHFKSLLSSVFDFLTREQEAATVCSMS